MTSTTELGRLLLECKPLYIRPDVVKHDVFKLVNINRSFTASLKQCKENEKDIVQFEINGDLPIHHEGRTKLLQLKIKLPAEYPVRPPVLELLAKNGSRLLLPSNQILLPSLYSWEQHSHCLVTVMKQSIVALSNTFPFQDIAEDVVNNPLPLFQIPVDPVKEIVKLMNLHRDLFVKKSISSQYGVIQQNEVGDTFKRLSIYYKTDVHQEQIITTFESFGSKSLLSLQAEPMSIQVQCNSMAMAKCICAVALKVGYGNTGIVYAKSGNIYCIIRSADIIKIPLTTRNGNQIIPRSSLPLLLHQAYEVLVRDLKRSNEFRLLLLEKLNQANISRDVYIVNYPQLTNVEEEELLPSLLTIPDNLLLTILREINITDLHPCRQVCKTLNNFISEKIWGSISGRQKMNEILDQNWSLKTFKESTHRFALNFHFPELLAISSSSFVVFENFKSFETLAVIDLSDEAIWVIEEPASRLSTVDIKLNQALLVLYKQKNYTEGILKVYSLKNRSVILETIILNFLELQIDNSSKEAEFLVLTREGIQVYNYNEEDDKMTIFQHKTEFVTKPLFANYFNKYLSYCYQTCSLRMVVMVINEEANTIEEYLNIEDFEDFAKISGPRSNIHNVIFYQKKFIIHACVEDEEGVQSCVFRAIFEYGILLGQYYMEDFYEYCMGDVRRVFTT